MSSGFLGDNYECNADWPEVDQTPRQRGLSKAAVDAIREAVLGSGKVPDGIRIPQEPLDAARKAILSGDIPPRGPSGHFQKGSSGNPKGRPNRAPEPAPVPPPPPDPAGLGAVALRHVSRMITARTEDGEVAMPLLEGIIAKIVQESAKGNTGHARTLVMLVAKAEANEAAHKRDVFRHWSEMRLRAIKLWTEAKRAGRPVPHCVHPDDIQLDADGSVTILGPTAPGEIAAMRHTYSRVEYHLINMAYQQWLGRRWQYMNSQPLPEGTFYAEVEFAVEQSELPPRLRLTAKQLSQRKRPYDVLAGRALHARLREEAAKFGLPVPPRELRRPVIIPRDAVEAAEENGVPKRKFLETWHEANTWTAGRDGTMLSRKG